MGSVSAGTNPRNDEKSYGGFLPSWFIIYWCLNLMTLLYNNHKLSTILYNIYIIDIYLRNMVNYSNTSSNTNKKLLLRIKILLQKKTFNTKRSTLCKQHSFILYDRRWRWSSLHMNRLRFYWKESRFHWN